MMDRRVIQLAYLRALTVLAIHRPGRRGRLAAAKDVPIAAWRWRRGEARKRRGGGILRILAVSGVALLFPPAAEGSRDGLFMLPAEISDIGYLNVKQEGVWVSVPDIEQRFQVGDKFSLVQRNMDYYIALDEREERPRRLFAVRRRLNDGSGSAWVTKQRDLIFGNLTETEEGIFYLQPGELLPIVVEQRDYYIVLCERHGDVFELSVPKDLPGVRFVRHLPKSLVWHDEEMRLQVVLLQQFRRGGNSPSETQPSSPPLQAKQSPSRSAESPVRPPTDPAAEATDGAPRPGGGTLSPPGRPPTDPLPPPAVSTPTLPSTPSTPLPGSHPPAAVSAAGSASLAAVARVPQRIPQSLPIEWMGTSQFIAELSRAMQQRAVQSLSTTQHEPAKRPASSATTATNTEPADTVDGATAAQDEGPLALPTSSALLFEDVSPSEPLDAADLPLPEVALMGNLSAPYPTSQSPVVTTWAALAASKLYIVIVLATIVSFLVLFIMVRLVNRRRSAQ